MSRTFKDKPYHVRLRENMEKGLIDHDHRPAEARTRVARYADRALSRTFFKRDTKAIAEYRAFLDGLDAITYEVVEREGTYTYDRDALRQGVYTLVSSPKTIELQVYRVITYEAQDLCTDAEHYDPRTQTDTRNGKRARCTPTWTRDLGRWDRGTKNAPTRAAVRAALAKAQGLANSGHLDEAYSDPTYEERFGKKLWTWDD